jgi:hypothetical protein
MKWNKLEYGKWPKGMILVRLEAEEGDVHYEIGFINQNKVNNEWYLYCNKPMPSTLGVDTIYDCNAHYIQLHHIDMPEDGDEQL